MKPPNDGRLAVLVLLDLPPRQRAQRLGEQADAVRRARSPRRSGCGRAARPRPRHRRGRSELHDRPRRPARPGGSRAGSARCESSMWRERRLALRPPRRDAPGARADLGALLAHLVLERRTARGRSGACARTGRRRAARPSPRSAAGFSRRASSTKVRSSVTRASVVACPPNRLRYAWMNASRSPSITRCTSPILSSVRWSLTIVYGWKT